jgi:hypothetical protein
VVADHLAAGPAPRRGRPAPGQHLHDPAGPPRRRLHLAARPHLVRDRGGPTEAHRRGGGGPRPRRPHKKG